MKYEKLKAAITLAGFSLSSLAREIGSSPQAFTQKVKRERLTDDELQAIAEKIGAEYVNGFRFKDGTFI